MPYELKPRTSRKLSPGRFYPLGAELMTEGVNFALYSQNAREVFLLLFDAPDREPTDVIKLEHRTRYVWHTFVHGLRPGQLYGYKVRGEYNPAYGPRFNENKLLIDPYAKALTGHLVNRDDLILGYEPHSPDLDLRPDSRDNTALIPKAIVIDDRFDWQWDQPPDLPLEKTIIYEAHVKGFTAHPSSRVSHPGTYLGFAENIPYLKDLGINAVELLPVHEFYVEDFLVKRGLSNYWGYNTLGFFAPAWSYGSKRAPGCQVNEFKTLVRELHHAGIEVILDVVYNHTCEGNELGPTVSFKGIDNPTYYCLCGPPEGPARHYQNYTGCGNSLNLVNPAVIRLVLDSLRYWVQVMHVDGFRFDLASVLGREAGWFRKSAGFFDAIAQDPVLNRTKLIAEPWDLGTYQVGDFPVDWSEWNGKFRDTLRKFGKGDAGQLRDLGFRLTGSADLYQDDGRSAYNSVNFITCHDGFTLQDLVSYNGKHNQANQENNQDGTNDNNSWNSGAEGDTDDPEILRLRKQLAKNYICYLLFSCGTPMLLGGDEFLRSQQGNNNAYCQDNEISWLNWDLARKNSDFLDFVKKAIAFTRRCTVLQRRKFLTGSDQNGNLTPDIVWSGTELNKPAWSDPEARLICYQLDGSEEPSELGNYLLFFILNSDGRVQYMKLPEINGGKKWRRAIDTSLTFGQDFADPGHEVLLDPNDHYLANPRSVVVLIGK